MGFESELRKDEQDTIKKNYFEGDLAKIRFVKRLNPNFVLSYNIAHQLHIQQRLGLETNADLKLSYTYDNFKLTQVVRNDSSLTFTGKADLHKWIPNTSLYVRQENTWLQFNQFLNKITFANKGANHDLRTGFNCSHERKVVEGKLQLNNATKLPTDAKYGVAVGAAYDLERKNFSIFKTALFYQIPRSISLSLISKNQKEGLWEVDNVVASLWNQVNDSTAFALRIQHNIRFNQSKFTAGFDSRLSNTTRLKFKVDEHFKADSALIYRVSDSVSVAVASKFDLKPSREKLVDDFIPIGFNLKVESK